MSRDRLKALGRRRFFRDLAVAGGAAAVLAASGRTTGGESARGEETDASAGSKGYRLTEHVNAYYGTLRI